LIRDFPDDPAAYEARAALAFYYFQTGDPERAHEYLEQIYRGLGLLDYRGFGAVLQDAEIYQMQEDYETALSTLDWALETVPHDAETTPELLMAKASLLVKSDNTTEGIRLYREMMLKNTRKKSMSITTTSRRSTSRRSNRSSILYEDLR